MLFQRSVLSIIKDGVSDEALSGMQKVFKVLYQMGGTAYLSALGYACSALSDRLLQNQLTLNPAVNATFKRIDEVLRKLIAGSDYEDPGLLKNVLFYVAIGSGHNGTAEKVVKAFVLGSYSANSAEEQGNSMVSAGLEPELVSRVVEALQTEVDQAKTWLDDCLHQTCDFQEAVENVEAILKRVDDTLVMVNTEEPRTTTRQLLDMLISWRDYADETAINPDELDQFATSVVNLENSLLTLAEGGTGSEQSGYGNAGATIIKESRASLTHIKNSISQFIEGGMNWDSLADVPANLAMVEGALRFYPLEDLGSVVNCTRRYVRESLLSEQRAPDQAEIDLFADVVVAIDYYLECLERGTAFNLDFLIERASDNCARLGYPVQGFDSDVQAELNEQVELDESAETVSTEDSFVTTEIEAPIEEPSAILVEQQDSAAAEADAPASEDQTEEAEDEIVGIFIEEAEELLPAAAEQLAAWREDDQNALMDLRRGFHTLKGGGRMVGATTIGELSWSLENLLNRVIDKTVAPQDEIFEVADQALQSYPELLKALSEGKLSKEASETARVPQDLLEELDRLSSSEPEAASDEIEPIETEIAAETPVTDAAPQEESIAEEITQVPTYSDSAFETSDSKDDEFERELMETFLEEGEDLVRDIDTSLKDWRQDPTNYNHADSIHRALHTLKGGARLSGLPELGSMSHDFESFIIDQQVMRNADESFFQSALDRLDSLNAHLEAVRQSSLSGGPIVEPEATVPEASTTFVPVAPEPTSVAPEDSAGDIAEPESLHEEAQADSETTAPIPEIDDQAAEQLRAATLDEAAADAVRRELRQETVRLRSETLDEMVNLAGESTVYRGRIEAQLNEIDNQLDELEATINRIQQLSRRLDVETEAQINFRTEQIAESEEELEFDPLEMDRYSTLQQLSRQLIESASDLQDLRNSLSEGTRDTSTLVIQSSRILTELNDQLMNTRMVPFTQLVPRLERITRQVSRELSKTVELTALNVEGELDRQVLEQILAPLEHILRNSIDHGIEEASVREAAGKDSRGHIYLNVRREGSYTVMRIADDGGGINLDAVRSRAVKNAIMGDGSVVVALDMPTLVNSYYRFLESGETERVEIQAGHNEEHTPVVMVVDDSAPVPEDFNLVDIIARIRGVNCIIPDIESLEQQIAGDLKAAA
eukprot:g16912.t1